MATRTGSISSATTSSPPTILLVESDALIRSPLAEYLRQCGYRVVEAVTASEARELLATDRVAVGLVFSEINLQGAENGFSLATWVRRNRPGIDVLLSVGATQAVQKASDVCGHGPAPSKPPGHEAILRRIQESLRKGAPTPD